MHSDDRAVEHAKWLEWMLKIFLTPEAYAASLPSSIWTKGDNGWVSVPR